MALWSRCAREPGPLKPAGRSRRPNTGSPRRTTGDREESDPRVGTAVPALDEGAGRDIGRVLDATTRASSSLRKSREPVRPDLSVLLARDPVNSPYSAFAPSACTWTSSTQL